MILEKKGRGRGMGFGGRPWAVRTFKLVQQSFEYYDGSKLKGTIDTKGSKTSIVSSAEGDGKEFPFQLDSTDGEKVLLNASSWVIRDKCIEVLNRSARNPNWDNKEDNDKARLEARLRELEYERVNAAKSGAAGVFNDQGANASLKKAGAADAAIKAENLKNAAASFKKVSAKQRFKEAKAVGDKKGVSEAAAEMIQGTIRIKLSRKLIEEQKIIKAKWIRDGTEPIFFCLPKNLFLRNVLLLFSHRRLCQKNPIQIQTETGEEEDRKDQMGEGRRGPQAQQTGAHAGRPARVLRL